MEETDDDWRSDTPRAPFLRMPCDLAANMHLLGGEDWMDGYGIDELRRVRGVLVEVASAGEKIRYADLAKRARLRWKHTNPNDRRIIGELLGEVSLEEYARGRPLITAVVVRKDTDEPGRGFLGLAGFPKTRSFWRSELKRVHDYLKWEKGDEGEE